VRKFLEPDPTAGVPKQFGGARSHVFICSGISLARCRVPGACQRVGDPADKARLIKMAQDFFELANKLERAAASSEG
jgi:hypothetical protein